MIGEFIFGFLLIGFIIILWRDDVICRGPLIVITLLLGSIGILFIISAIRQLMELILWKNIGL